MSEKCKDRLDFKIKTDSVIICLDRADLSRSRLRAGRRDQARVGTRAAGHGFHLAARATGLTGI